MLHAAKELFVFVFCLFCHSGYKLAIVEQAKCSRKRKFLSESLALLSLLSLKGPNCFAGIRVIPAGERVNIDEQTVCYCTYQDGTWYTHPHATCEQRPKPTLTPSARNDPSVEEESRRKGGNPYIPRLDVIP